MHRRSVFAKAGALFSTVGMPRWYAQLTAFMLLPIALWPFVFYDSVFIFDDPNNLLKAFGLFIIVNCYPLFLAGLVILSRRLFFKIGPATAIIPVVVLASFVCGLYLFFS